MIPINWPSVSADSRIVINVTLPGFGTVTGCAEGLQVTGGEGEVRMRFPWLDVVDLHPPFSLATPAASWVMAQMLRSE